MFHRSARILRRGSSKAAETVIRSAGPDPVERTGSAVLPRSGDEGLASCR